MSRGQPAVALDRARGRPHRSQPRLARSIAVLCATAGLLLALLIATFVVRAAAPGATADRARPRSARVNTVLLVMQPRTLTQVAHAWALRLEMTAKPLMPGPNRLVVTLLTHGRAVSDAQVRMRAIMVGMIMRPIILTATDSGRGRYSAVAPLPMFGPWLITVRVQRHGRAPLARVFGLTLELPAEAVTQSAAGATTHR